MTSGNRESGSNVSFDIEKLFNTRRSDIIQIIADGPAHFSSLSTQELERLSRYKGMYVFESNTEISHDQTRRLDFLRWLRETGRLQS